MQQWLGAYLITCAIEIPIVIAMTGGLGWRSRGPRPRLEVAALAWALQLTHPVLWLVNPAFPVATVMAELAVVAIEGIAICRWAVARTMASCGGVTLRWSLLIAFCANAASVLAGLLIAVVAAAMA
ncbi:hypothetical protein [Brooklawnia sp.]|uniref:hypothetical protein n=1 Tax=Brooklawnia sp. TaxID=2699740 RepID=UPI00311FB2E6